MAEYYPLLAKAVAGRHKAPAAERQAIYDRARQALLAQLRSMDVPAEAIERESDALDEAIARAESEVVASLAAAAGAAEMPSPAVERPNPAPPPLPPAAEVAPVTLPPADIPPPVPVPAVEAPPVEAPAPPPRPLPSARPGPVPPVVPAASVRPRPPRPAAEALSRIVAERPTASPEVRVPPRSTPEAEAPGEAARPAPLPSAPTLQVPSFTDILDASAPADAGAVPEEAETVAAASGPDEPPRPPAPRPAARERTNPRFLILALVGAMVVAGIAYAAWRLRDRPDALARSRAAMLAAQQAEAQQTAKVSARADTPASGDRALPAQGPTPTPASPAPVAPPAPAASMSVPPATAPAAPAATPAPATAPETADGAAATAPSDAVLPVSQRAAFLVEAPDDPQKVKTYVGTVVWSIGSSNPAQNQPIAQSVRADITIPDAALKLSMVMQKNFEAQFPASHTLEFRFALEPGNTLGAIKQINTPQMRQETAETGDALLGLPVTITENYFLVGLSRGDAVAHNLDLIRSRNWFDVPILLASGKVAKMQFEKGTAGQKIVDDVLQSWQ